jgi:hypothetical protein
MTGDEYARNVFINCPFDAEYAPLFEAIVFAVNDAGFRPKCARERLDSSQVRIQKISALIAASRYSIHDLSRTALDSVHALSKFVSDLSGQDIADHGNDPRTAVTRVRNWLRTESRRSNMPGGPAIYVRYENFRAELPAICAELKLDESDLTFADLSYAIAQWLETHQA